MSLFLVFFVPKIEEFEGGTLDHPTIQVFIHHGLIDRERRRKGGGERKSKEERRRRRRRRRRMDG